MTSTAYPTYSHLRPAWGIPLRAPAATYDEAAVVLSLDASDIEDIRICIGDFVVTQRPYHEDFYGHVEAVDEPGGRVKVWSKRSCAGGWFALDSCAVVVKAAALETEGDAS